MAARHSKCKICGKEHALGGCPEFQSTAARKDVRQRDQGISPDLDRGNAQGGGQKPEKPRQAATQALPVDTPPKPKMGRPRTGYIKAEYNRQYMADLRTIKRLGLSVTVSQYRKSKET